MVDQSTRTQPGDETSPPAKEGDSAKVHVSRFRGTSRYEIVGRLGQGSMGIVYEAIDRQRHERVALKTLINFDASGLYQFKQEFRTLADVTHPNLVHLHELVAGDRDEVFFTMELVEGTDFLEYVLKPGTPRSDYESETREPDSTGIRKAGQFTIALKGSETEPPRPSPAQFDKLRPALRQLVQGLLALHSAGKLHRDIKPSNVRVTPEGRVVILDFGVATELRRRPGESGDDGLVGSITYMAPEQSAGDAPIPASDWYSVGAMLYEAIVGRPPFCGSAIEVLALKNTCTPVAPSSRVQGVPADLDSLCMALLDSEPRSRPNGADILRRLGATVSDHPSVAPADGSDAIKLVGRERQLGELRAAFEATRAGQSIAVRVSGLTGLGKSALVNHFLDELEDEHEVLVLRGRAYERESVPYKAVDTVIDALSRHLLELSERGDGPALPKEIWTLAHVFPVLSRVHDIDEVPQASVGDPRIVRQRAFNALRELVDTLARRQPVVIFIDDVQWGDNDSAALLLELMRPPDAPPLLLVMTHREEDANRSTFLANLDERWPEDAEVRGISVGPLEFEDAKRLALHLLGSDNNLARENAESIARESGGSPFLVEELARSASAHFRATERGALLARGSLTLDEIFAERAARLPADARRLLEVVAVGGRPLSVSTIGVAANNEESAPQLVALLRARRFVRTGLRNGFEVVEAIHDRIRDTIVALLPGESARGYHGRLASALEASPDADPEAIASHLLGAGNKERAAHFAERAAEQAIAKLAFAQAARLFQLTIDTVPSSSQDAGRLYRRLAEACEWAGLAEKSARAYLAAAEGVPALERVNLERAAAAQLIAAGRIDEGGAILRRVLGAVGRPVPGSMLGILLGAIFYRVVSAFWLKRARIRDRMDVTFEERVRLDALSAAARGLSVIDPFSVMYVKARYLVDALRAGDVGHIVHAACQEAATLVGVSRREGKRDRTLFEMARRLAEETKDQEAYALYQTTYGIGRYLRGQWRVAVEILDVACRQLTAARRWNANANVYALYAMMNLGNLREVKSRAARLIADAEQRGDLYTAVNLRASHPIAAWLAANDVDGARRHLRESIAQWSKTRFLVQHWQAMLWNAEVDLYAGDGASAWERLSRDEREVRRNRLLMVQLIRAFTSYVRGRAAIASLRTLPEADRRQRLAKAREAAEQLERESMTWTAPLAAIVAGCHAMACGDSVNAERSLRRAIALGSAAEMSLHVAAARYQLGSMLGGEVGEALKTEAEEAFHSCGVRVPSAYAQQLVPGIWVRCATDS